MTVLAFRHRVRRCAECGARFTRVEWDRRHWRDSDREDVHEGCCPDCKENQ